MIHRIQKRNHQKKNSHSSSSIWNRLRWKSCCAISTNQGFPSRSNSRAETRASPERPPETDPPTCQAWLSTVLPFSGSTTVANSVIAVGKGLLRARGGFLSQSASTDSLFVVCLKMETSESLTQDVGSNRPDLDILEDIEIEELGLGEKGEGKGMASKNGNSSKKRKNVERSDVWAEFDKVIVDSVKKGKCKRCDSLIAADPKLNGTSAMWKHHASCLKKHEAGKNQTTLSQDDSGACDSNNTH
ncbi:hypothetical protein SASPL_115010 [Salvia splendens]|uniref:BED-type domain-containing protein n=1 Tax=Salvia splendens TaxID=180675 RepID=A0A8X8ZZW5_SALSN|nr:hypothetical protein SASPL_115010 [Salvia splendens]